jgi:hypothetical protein
MAKQKIFPNMIDQVVFGLKKKTILFVMELCQLPQIMIGLRVK